MGVIYYGLPQRLTLSVWLPQRISYETVRCKGLQGYTVAPQPLNNESARHTSEFARGMLEKLEVRAEARAAVSLIGLLAV